MGGTKVGGIKAAQTNKERHGEDYFVKVGRLGGIKKGVRKGFATNPELAKIAGRKGGKISRRGKVKK